MRVLPHPFKPLRSFLAYATGDERVEVKTEWAQHYPEAKQSDEPEQTQTIAQAGRR